MDGVGEGRGEEKKGGRKDWDAPGTEKEKERKEGGGKRGGPEGRRRQ